MGSSFLQRKWVSASLLVKSRSISEKSPTFFGKSPTFLGKSPTFFRERPLFLVELPLRCGISRKSGEMQGEATDFLKPWAEIGGNAQRRLWAFSSLLRDKKGRCVLELLKVVRNPAANCWKLGCYKEICEGCESKKQKTPVGCAHACAREKAN